MAEKELFGNSEQLDCSDCVNHGGDWECDHVHCRKGTDTISRQWLMECVEEGWIKFDTQEDENRFVHLIRDIAPSAQPVAKDINVPIKDCISRQAAIDALNLADDRGQIHSILDVIDVINSVPSAQQWIPCSERLPEEYGEYRITWTTSASKKQFVGDSEYEITSEWDDEHYRFKGEWLLDDYIKNYPDVKVIAWKPIEEPYKENPDAD